MRYPLTLAVVAAFVGGSSIAAHAQAHGAVVVIPGAGVPGTGIVNGPGAAGAGTGTRWRRRRRPRRKDRRHYPRSGDWRYLGYDSSWDRRS